MPGDRWSGEGVSIRGLQIEAVLMHDCFSSSFLFLSSIQRMQKREMIPHLPSPLTSHLSLRGLKASLFPQKETSYKREEREGGEKNHPAFCAFLSNGSCLSHCRPLSHPYTLRAVAAVSKSTAKIPHGTSPPLSSPPNPTQPLPTRVSERRGCVE